MKYSLIRLLLVGVIGLAGCVPLAATPGSIAAAAGESTPEVGATTPEVEAATLEVGAGLTPEVGAGLTPEVGAATPEVGTAATPEVGAATPEVGVGAVCPGPTDALQRLVVARHGYCLAYPAEYKVEKASLSLTALVIGGGLSVAQRVHITVSDAQGQTLEEAAQRLEADYNVGYDPKRSGTTVAGEPAVVFDGLTGEDVNRRVLFVHDGLLYELYFAPSDPANADVYGRLQTLYKQVIGSFTFIPRSEAAVDVDDCLSPSATTRLLTDRERGLCLLYPADLALNESADGSLALAAGSPEGDNPSKVVIQVKDAGGKTAEQLADEVVAEAQRAAPEATVERSFGLTIGYEAAQLLHGVPGPELSRHVLAVHDGKLYHLTFTPEAPWGNRDSAKMQPLYDLIVRSFRFIAPGS